jgi:hypothetical protein
VGWISYLHTTALSPILLQQKASSYFLKEELACRIKEIVEGAGTSFAFPSTSIYVETVPTEQAEVFVPPSATESKG